MEGPKYRFGTLLHAPQTIGGSFRETRSANYDVRCALIISETATELMRGPPRYEKFFGVGLEKRRGVTGPPTGLGGGGAGARAGAGGGAVAGGGGGGGGGSGALRGGAGCCRPEGPGCWSSPS